MAMSHATCDHPSTPAARRVCRAANGVQHPTSNAGAAPVVTPAAVRNARLRDMQNRLNRAGDDIKMTGAVARRMARQAAKADRIQPRRSGARVAATNSTCVQAALHIDAHGGRCACGWTANQAA